MSARTGRLSTIALVAAFICGALMLLFPLAAELNAYQTDAAEYASIAEVFKPPDITPAVIAPMPAATAQATEQTATSEVPASESARTPSTEEKPQDLHTIQPTEPPESTPAPEETEDSFSALLAQNEDFVAWIMIPGTVIDYPVVRSNRTDYYLNHLFTGTKSKLGCLFSLANADYETPGKNIAIYGHHLNASDAMFSTLVKYKDSSYWEKHQTITLRSLYHYSTYRIFAVLNMKVSDWDPATASFSGDKAFLSFVNRAKKKALYDTGISVGADDYILTLITCDRSYGGASGRLVVMAVME